MRPELEEAKRKIRNAAEAATREATEDLLARSVPLAPILEGVLRGSGHIEEGEISFDKIELLVVFATPYAAKQHEELDYEHPRGGQAKYLEQPLTQMAPRYAAFIAERIRRVTGA